MAKTSIPWADATWNPTTGCSKVSAGCANCYAEHFAQRLAGRCWYPADEPFRVTLHPERLEEPLRWRKPRRIFVNSMSDLFHPDMPMDFLFRVFAAMGTASQHTYIILTKRPHRFKEILPELNARLREDGRAPFGQGWKHVWLGVTAENQAAADEPARSCCRCRCRLSL